MITKILPAVAVAAALLANPIAASAASKNSAASRLSLHSAPSMNNVRLGAVKKDQNEALSKVAIVGLLVVGGLVGAAAAGVFDSNSNPNSPT